MTLEESEVLEKHDDASEQDGETQQFLTFTVANNEYGVDIMSVREIKGWEETTRIPNSPEFMRGVINLRGVVIPIFDLRTRFSMGVTDAHPKNVVIILAVGDRTIGILADAVSDILTVNSEEIKPAPSSSTEVGVDKAYISGLISRDEAMVVLLDVEHLFSEETLAEADSAGSNTQTEEQA